MKGVFVMYYNTGYIRNNYGYSDYYGRDGRYGGFVVPFLLGGLVGGAAVGVTRPRPIVATPYPPPPPPYYGPVWYPRPFY